MNGDLQMLPVHTIRIRASWPMTEVRSAHALELGRHVTLQALADGSHAHHPEQPESFSPYIRVPALQVDVEYEDHGPDRSLAPCRRSHAN